MYGVVGMDSLVEKSRPSYSQLNRAFLNGDGKKLDTHRADKKEPSILIGICRSMFGKIKVLINIMSYQYIPEAKAHSNELKQDVQAPNQENPSEIEEKSIEAKKGIVDGIGDLTASNSKFHHPKNSNSENKSFGNKNKRRRSGHSSH